MDAGGAGFLRGEPRPRPLAAKIRSDCIQQAAPPRKCRAILHNSPALFGFQPQRVLFHSPPQFFRLFCYSVAMKVIVYARKSSESEERQALSIEAQLTELREFAAREQLEIVASLCEAKTA